MSDSVIALLADESYMPHAKSLMVNCVRQGNWKGGICLIVPEDWDVSDLESRGIFTARAPRGKVTMLGKWRIFSDYFHKWQRVLYLDCDIIVQGDLNKAVDGMSAKLPALLMDGGTPGDGTILHNWEHFDNLNGEGVGAHPEVYERLKARFPHVDQVVFCADVMFFAPDTIPAGTEDKLYAVYEEFREACPGGNDQPVINLVLYDRMARTTKDYCCWFAFDYPENRVPSEANGWRGDEEPAILHYWNMYAPWLVKQEGAGGHWNHRLGRVCHELYAENLAAFEETFPIL